MSRRKSKKSGKENVKIIESVISETLPPTTPVTPPIRIPSEISIISSDGDRISVDTKVRKESKKIREMMKHSCIYGRGPYYVDVESNVLRPVLRWCLHYSDDNPELRGKSKRSTKSSIKSIKSIKSMRSIKSSSKANIDQWETDFLNVNLSHLRMYFIGARKMGAISLVRAICQKYAAMIQDKNEYDVIEMLRVTKFDTDAQDMFQLLWNEDSNNFISSKAKDFFVSYMTSSIQCDIADGKCQAEVIDVKDELTANK